MLSDNLNTVFSWNWGFIILEVQIQMKYISKTGIERVCQILEVHQIEAAWKLQFFLVNYVRLWLHVNIPACTQ